MVDFEKLREANMEAIDRTGGAADGGLTIRDYFAAHAIKQSYPARRPAHVARIAYEIADAMLKERQYIGNEGMAIHQLNLTVRAENALVRHDIGRVKELTSFTAKEILSMEGVGMDTLRNIQEALAELGFALKGDPCTVEEAFGL